MRRTILPFFILMGPLMTAAVGETRTLNLTNFDQVSVRSGMHVSINQGEGYRVEVTGDPENLERLEVEQIYSHRSDEVGYGQLLPRLP